MALAAIVLNVLEASGGGGGTTTNSWLSKSLAAGMAKHMIWLIVMVLLVTQSKG
jgi:hypothetical protein